MNETEIAAGIATGALPSPTQFGESFLVALRISGTGLSERPALNEKVWRDPKIWLSDETIVRVSGLTVSLDHPDAAVMNPEEYALRSVGAVILGYPADRSGIQDPSGPDLWGVARLFLDADMMNAISKQSTSPGVAFTKSDGNQRIVLDDGTECLVENSPTDINHCAIVLGEGAGVWDKGLDTERGIRFDIRRNTQMDEEMTAADRARKDAEEQAKKDAEGSGIEKLMKHLDSKFDAMDKRMDAIEKRGDTRKDGAATEETEAERKTRQEREELDREDRARKDARLTPAKIQQDRKDDAEKAEAQTRCDTVAQAFGQRAPAPMMGEKPLAYRKRLLRGFARHSTFKDADFDTIAADAATFANVENIVYADALKASKTPEVADGHLLKRTKRDPDTGHVITEFFGNHTFISELKRPSLRAQAFLTPQHLSGRG